MTDDIVDLVRDAAESHDYSGVDGSVGDVLDAAADEIEALRRTVEDLRARAEQDACAIEKLQAERDRWRDIAAGLAETSRHGGYCPSYDGFGCDAECGVGDALAAYEDEKGKHADGLV